MTSQDDDGGPGGVPGGVGEDVSPGVTPHDGAGVQVIRPQLEKKYLIYKFTHTIKWSIQISRACLDQIQVFFTTLSVSSTT